MAPIPPSQQPRKTSATPDKAATATGLTANSDPNEAGSNSAESLVSLRRWCSQNGFGFEGEPKPEQGFEYTVLSPLGTLNLRPGSQVARWEGMSLYLGFPPVVINDEAFVRSLEVRKTLIPLLSPRPSRYAPSNKVIAIDPGHGGHDSGTHSALSGQYEKDFTLDWALRLKSVLARDGYEPILTHAGDVDMTISNRVVAADVCRATVFVSLHFNASGNGGEQAGVETYCITPPGMPSSMTRGYDDDPTIVFPNNSFDSENLRLACGIHQSLLRVNGNHDRGVRRARFLSVLRGQRRPAVLVEGGYLSNPAEARLIGTPQYRQQLAEAVGAALAEFFDTLER